MITRLCFLLSILSLPAYAVVHKGAKRREASISGSYGPPPNLNYGPPVPVYGAPGPAIKYPPPPPDLPPFPQVPHTEYGVPQQLPHREYGVPALKYGPPKLNIEYGAPMFKKFPQKTGGGFAQSLQSAKASIYDQIKSHFGVPKPSYGPPHPNSFNPQGSYGIPAPNYGPPKPLNANYGPPSKPAPSYGPPPAVYGLPLPPQPSGLYGRPQQPGPSYGPPSPPLPIYGGPSAAEEIHSGSLDQELLSHVQLHQQAESNYLPPNPPPPSYGAPEVGAGSSYQGNIALPPKIEHLSDNHGFGNENHLTGVSCDGWKPIPGPTGHRVETSSSYSNVHSSSIGGLTDDQLIAVALQAAEEPRKQLPSSIGFSNDFQSQNFGGGSLQMQAVQLSHGGGDSYSKPPPDSYAPNSIHAFKYNGNDLGVGLVPPSGIYGIPQGGSYHSSFSQQHGGKFASQNPGINYGSVSGNLKPWATGGSAPKKPIFFRPPVPQGFLESIGASVQHLDQYGTRPENEPPTYIPPPPAEVPHHHPDDQNLSPHASENIAYAQALPSGQEPRFNQAQDCGHGPNLNDGNFQFSQPQLSGYDFSTNHITGYNNLESNFGQVVVPSGPSGPSGLDGSDVSGNYLSAAATSSDSYGPPPSGNEGDAIGYESKQAQVSSSQSTSSNNIQKSSEVNKEQLPGLENLNVISAEKSHSVTIPVHGQLGTYQFQFQGTNPIASALNSNEPANHEQILSQGLLQSIISAIEQPNVVQQSIPGDATGDHNEVDKFVNSPEGRKVLNDSHAGHK